MRKNALLPWTLLSVLVLTSCGLTSSSQSESQSDSKSTSVTSDVSTSIDENTYSRTLYQNPLKTVDENGNEYFVAIADPDVIYGEDGYWYLYPTNTPVRDNEGNQFFDLGPIFQSKDLITWKWVGSVFRDYPEAINWGSPGAGVWAPSVIKVNNTYNYYYSLSTWGDDNPGIGVATSSTPYGPWTHHGRVLDSVSSGVKNSIDPQAIYDGNELYLLWGSFFGIAAIRLTDDGIEPFYGADYKNNIHWLIEDNTTGSMNINLNYEGSYVFKYNGQYYYTGSQGSCCSGSSSTYRVKVGVSNSLFGPYKASSGEELSQEPYGDLVIGPSDDVAGTGHHTIIQDFAGQYWIIYHGFDVNGLNPNERILFIDPLKFDEDTGMPYVENYVASYKTNKLGPVFLK